MKELLKLITRSNEMSKEGWTTIKKLPTESMKVRWICKDGKEGLGFYYSDTKTFTGFDLNSEKPITHWKPFQKSAKK